MNITLTEKQLNNLLLIGVEIGLGRKPDEWQINELSKSMNHYLPNSYIITSKELQPKSIGQRIKLNQKNQNNRNGFAWYRYNGIYDWRGYQWEFVDWVEDSV